MHASFGNPDGSRGPLDGDDHNFVVLPARYGAVGRPIDENTRARVVVGGQGVGKTLFLRRMQVYFRHHESVISTYPTLESSELDTETVIRFSQIFDRTSNSEFWSKMWESAILLSAARHLINDESGRGSVAPELLAELAEVADELLPDQDLEDAVEITANLCRGVTGRTDYERLRNDARWAKLKRRVARVLRDSPELYLFLDAVDDNFHYAPAYWMQCQRGLFHAVMHAERRDVLAAKLHVVISIRDLVFSSIQRSEHALRYQSDDDHLVNLTWTWGAGREFLLAKLQTLPQELFRDADRTIESFFGRNAISNSVRGIEEPIEQYLLRHTRLNPREIILLGNAILKTAEGCDVRPWQLSDVDIRGAVAVVATRAARAAMGQAGNQILTNVMPWSAARRGFVPSYLNENEYTADGMLREIRSVMIRCGSEIFDDDTRGEVEAEAERRFGPECHFFDALWQNGLVGAIRDARPHYYRDALVDETTLPIADRYCIHPVSLDLLPGLDLEHHGSHLPNGSVGGDA